MDSDHNYQYSSAGSSICKCESESCLSCSSEFTKSVTQSEKCETGDGFSDGNNRSVQTEKSSQSKQSKGVTFRMDENSVGEHSCQSVINCSCKSDVGSFKPASDLCSDCRRRSGKKGMKGKASYLEHSIASTEKMPSQSMKSPCTFYFKSRKRMAKKTPQTLCDKSENENMINLEEKATSTSDFRSPSKGRKIGSYFKYSEKFYVPMLIFYYLASFACLVCMYLYYEEKLKEHLPITNSLKQINARKCNWIEKLYFSKC